MDTELTVRFGIGVTRKGEWVRRIVRAGCGRGNIRGICGEKRSDTHSYTSGRGQASRGISRIPARNVRSSEGRPWNFRGASGVQQQTRRNWRHKGRNHQREVKGPTESNETLKFAALTAHFHVRKRPLSAGNLFQFSFNVFLFSSSTESIF